MQRLIRHDTLPQEILPLNSDKHSFISLFIQSLFIYWGYMVEYYMIYISKGIPEFGLRIFKILLVFIMERLVKIQSHRAALIPEGQG